MLLLLVITLPICIEIAAWACSETLEKRLLGSSTQVEFDELIASQSDTVISF